MIPYRRLVLWTSVSTLLLIVAVADCTTTEPSEGLRRFTRVAEAFTTVSEAVPATKPRTA